MLKRYCKQSIMVRKKRQIRNLINEKNKMKKEKVVSQDRVAYKIVTPFNRFTEETRLYQGRKQKHPDSVLRKRELMSFLMTSVNLKLQ